MFTFDQFKGIAERIVYSVVLFLAMKAVAKGYIDSDMANYLAAGAMAAVGSVWAWWNNRPSALLDRAGNSISDKNRIVITPTASASPADRQEAVALAAATGDKVSAKT